MSNFVSFDANFKFVNLKRGLFLEVELGNIPTEQWKNEHRYVADQWTLKASQIDRKFFEMVVSTVKNTHFTTHQKTCCISLKTLLPPPSECCPSPLIAHLTVIAQILYHSYGIEIRQVDDMRSPQNMVVAWHRDNLWLNPPSPFLVQSRKEGFRTDCTLQFGEKLYTVHGVVLAAKSPYFEKMFKINCKGAEFGAIIPIIMTAVEEKSVEMVLDYFYTGELDLKDASINRIDDLVNLSSYFDMPRLAQICFEQLCKNVNADNLQEYIAVARHYDHKELELALTGHIVKEVTIDNFAELIQLGKNENIEDLEGYCTLGITDLINKIDYEPCGFGKSTQLKYFKSLLDAIIKTQSSLMLSSVIVRMREVLSHPGYGTHLEKLIEYLALTCEYQPHFDWLPNYIPNDLITIKDMLYKEILQEIKRRAAVQGEDELYEDYFKWSLFEECFAVAEKYQLEELKDISSGILMKK